MKKRDIIQLVKESIEEMRAFYGSHDNFQPTDQRRNLSGMPGVMEEETFDAKDEYEDLNTSERERVIASAGGREEDEAVMDYEDLKAKLGIKFDNAIKDYVMENLKEAGPSNNPYYNNLVKKAKEMGIHVNDLIKSLLKDKSEMEIVKMGYQDLAALAGVENLDEFKTPKSFDPDTIRLVRDMLEDADIHHNDLVGGYDEPSSYLDKRTGGTIIKIPHFNGPQGRGAMFGKETTDKIDRSKAAAKTVAAKLYYKFKQYIEDYEISDKSPAGVYGNVILWMMFNDLAKDYSAPKGGTQSSQFEEIDEAPLFRTGIKMDMAPEVMAPRLKKVFDKVNGAKDPVRTPEWHKNRFKNKYGISFPETLKGINKDQALAMNKYANDMSIRETKNIKEIGHLVTTKGGETKYMDIEPKVAQQMKGDAGVTGIETVTGTTIKEDDLELTNNIGKDDYVDDEGRMAKSQMYKTGKYAMKLHDMMDDMEQLPAWVQAKLTKASDYLSAVYHYLDYEFVRRDSNLMEHVDKYKKRAVLMEGAMKKFFEMFDKGKTDEEIVQDYAHKGTTVPETFVTKARRQYEGMKKLKLELEMSEKEFRNSSEKMVNNAEEGMEPGMEEKKLASKLYNEEEVDEVSYDNSGLENPKAADISKDGDISDYELKRGKAIEKAIDKQKNK